MADLKSLLRVAEACLFRGELAAGLQAACEARAVCATLPASAMPRRESRLAVNLHGLFLHLDGRYDEAAPKLEEALSLAEAAARLGLAHDQLVCCAGALGDIGANALALGDAGAALKCSKRAEYMLNRAYRPSEAARGMG